MLPEQEELLSRIAQPLLTWYDSNRRVLPWREDPTPYHVWVSEIMLQQTRVEAVKEYYARFLRELPTIRDLAEAEEDLLLKLWEGLGYYNRVRNMQKCAQVIEREYGGRMPGNYEELLALPGIGNYTAGAISSIAFGQVNPAVDGNVLRVVTRVLADDTDIMNTGFRSKVEQSLRSEMSGERPGDFNQAMMDIGATVCVPNGAPHCKECPLHAFCKACAKGTQTRYPVKKAQKERRVEDKTVLLMLDADRIALHKRPSKGLLAGMYEFPMLDGKHTDQEVLQYLKDQGLQTIQILSLGEAKHVFSHIEWHMIGYWVRVDELTPFRGEKQQELADGTVFVEIEKASREYAIPSAFSAYAKQLNIKRGEQQ